MLTPLRKVCQSESREWMLFVRAGTPRRGLTTMIELTLHFEERRSLLRRARYPRVIPVDRPSLAQGELR